MSNEMETRTVNSPRTGTKVSWIIAASAVAVAVYYYTTATHFTGKDGGIFGCGSPMSPNNNSLGKSQCHIIETTSLHKALLFLALALITAILGTLLFGMEKSTQTRAARSRLDDEREDQDDDELADERGSRSGLLSGRQERRFGQRKGVSRAGSKRARLGDEDFDDDEREEDAELGRSRVTRVKGEERSREPRFDDDLDDENIRAERKKERRRRLDEDRAFDDDDARD